MPIRHTQSMQLGTHEGRIGFTMRFEDGTEETHLFDLVTAESLFRQGLALIAIMQQQARQAEERLGLQEQAIIRLIP